MSERRFYHLTRTGLEKAVASLSQTIVNRDMRVLILAKDKAQVEAIDHALWQELEFLPHAVGEPDGLSKIVISENPTHKSDVVIALDDVNVEAVGSELLCCMFHSVNADHVAKRREDWKAWSDEGLFLTYWSQTEEGGWEKKSEANKPKSE